MLIHECKRFRSELQIPINKLGNGQQALHLDNGQWTLHYINGQALQWTMDFTFSKEYMYVLCSHM